MPNFLNLMSKSNITQGDLSFSVSEDLVTVVICKLNEERGLGETIDGLKKNGFKNLVIVEG
jgi:hypothetical protein